MAAPVPPPPMVIADEVHAEMAEHDDHDENMRSYSAEFQVEGIRNNRNEENRLTEAEKNERVQRQLMVRYTIYTHTTVHMNSVTLVVACLLVSDWLVQVFKNLLIS